MAGTTSRGTRVRVAGMAASLAVASAFSVLTATPAHAKSYHHCGSLIITGVGETGDLNCLGEKKDPNVGNLMGSLPTCGDTGERYVQVGLRGVYKIVYASRYATTYGGRSAWRYRWNYVISPGTFAGYRYCKR